MFSLRTHIPGLHGISIHKFASLGQRSKISDGPQYAEL